MKNFIFRVASVAKSGLEAYSEPCQTSKTGLTSKSSYPFPQIASIKCLTGYILAEYASVNTF